MINLACQRLRGSKKSIYFFWGLRPQTPIWSAFGLQMDPLGPGGTLWDQGGTLWDQGRTLWDQGQTLWDQGRTIWDQGGIHPDPSWMQGVSILGPG